MKHFLKHYITWLFVGLGLTNLVALLQLDFWHIGAAFAGVYTLLVPGLLVLSFLVKKKLPLALGIALSAALSIALLMAAGLFINTVFPWTGVMNPLSPLKLLATFDVMMLALLGIHIWHWRPFPLELPKFSRLDQIVAGGAVLMPILAVLGTTSLNNGGSNLFTMFSIGLVASYVPLLVYLKRRVNAAV